MTNILIVEDDLDMADTCAKIFQKEGYRPWVVNSGIEAMEKIMKEDSYKVVLADLIMPGMDGIELLRKIKDLNPAIEVIIMTGYGTIASAVEAIKLGAADYITKPFQKEELLKTVERTIEVLRLKGEVSRLKKELRDRYGFDNIIGRSSQMYKVLITVAKACESDCSVLISGDSGTGKELIARTIHYSSFRAKGPFVPVNCGALPEDLMESELFGHKKGSYTGATSDTLGLFRVAEGGTIFLDEVAEMPLMAQVRLLRVLQEKTIRPVGGTEEIPVDVRVIAATNREIGQALTEGHLREDLFFRLRVISIHIPPLRERKEDVPLLVNFFIKKFNASYRRKVKGIEPKALRLLMDYPWPGNIRELGNVIEGAFALGRSEFITMEDIEPNLGTVNSYIPSIDLPQVFPLRELEKTAIEKALQESKGNKSMAAKTLGISRTRLYKKIKDYSIIM